MSHLEYRQARLVQYLADKIDIQDVIYNYCRAVDRSDEEVIAACFHPDATCSYGAWSEKGGETCHHITPMTLKPGARCLHFVGNIHSEVTGNYAFVESYVLAHRAYECGAQSSTSVRAVRFIDIFERRNAIWRIRERTIIDEFNSVDEVLQQQPGLDQPGYSTLDKPDATCRVKARFDELSSQIARSACAMQIKANSGFHNSKHGR